MPLGTVYVDEESPRAGAEPVFGYRLIQRLGSGGHGEVWRAEAPGGFQVAMKFMRLDNGLGATEIRSLEILRGLRHPNLLLTFGAWQLPGYLVLGMELADRTLWDRFSECVDEGLPGIPRDELIEYLSETAKGVDYLNEPKSGMGVAARSGIQHRDLKPQNILLAGGGVKVGDFGLARQLDKSMASHTGHWTFAYAAPEFFRRQTSGQSDQYSLAATYCHLRCGQPPFSGPPAVIMAGHLLLPPELTMIPEEERPVVARALAKSPKDRWPSCRAFIEALRAARPVPAPVPFATPAPAALGLRPAEFRAPEAAEFASSDEIVIRVPAPPPTTQTFTPATPADPTEWTTKVFDEEFADIPDVLALALDSPSDDDLPAYVEVEPGDEPADAADSADFEPEGLLAALNESPPRGRRRRFLKAGLVAAAAMVGGVGLWVAGGHPRTGRNPVDIDRIALAGPQPTAPPAPTPPDRAAPEPGPAGPEPAAVEVRRDEPASPADPQVEKAGLRDVAQARPAPAAPPPAEADQGPPLVPPVVADPGPPEEAVAVALAPRVPRVRLAPPPPLTVQAGRTARLEVKALRDGFDGPLTARLEGLPEGVQAGVASFPPGADRATVEVRAGAGLTGREVDARLVARAGAERIEVPVTVLVAESAAQRFLDRGLELFKLEQYEDAAANLDEALRLDPPLAGVHMLRGSAWVHLKQYERAILDFKEAIRRNPDDAVAFNNCGLAYSGRGDYYRAISYYSEAVRLSPRNASIRFNRGKTYHITQDEQMALADLNKAIELNPNDARFYETRAEILKVLGEGARSGQDLEKARALGGVAGRPRGVRPNPAPPRAGKPAATKRAARVAAGPALAPRAG